MNTSPYWLPPVAVNRQPKKIGFWGFVITSLVAVAVNLNIGLGIAQSLIGLIGILILYAVLQIKADNVSAWNNLE